MESPDHLPNKASRIAPWWLAPFTRITSGGGYIPEIDGLRFIAIAWVISHHLALLVQTIGPNNEGAFVLGQKGVELFFAISGFILAVPFAKQYLQAGKRLGIGQYFLRRLTRLEPPYLLSLILIFALKLAIHDKDPIFLLQSFTATALYVHNYVYGTMSYISGVAWSLEIEVQFYILMPLLALIFVIRSAAFRRTIMLLVMVGIVYFQPIHIGSYLGWRVSSERHLGNYLQFFIAGILLADVYVARWKSAPMKARWGDLVWLFGWPLLTYLFWLDRANIEEAHASIVAALFAPLIFVLYASMFKGNIARRLMSIPVIATIGGMCYSIYLVHNTLILLAGTVVSRFIHGRPFTVQMIVSTIAILPIILIGSGFFFVLVERPCMRRDWPRRLAGSMSKFIFVDVADQKSL